MELIEEAMAIVSESAELKSPSANVHNLKVLHNASIVDLAMKSLCETHERMEGGMNVGYARVSTDGQSLDAQHAALKAAGCVKVFSEKFSGPKTDRAGLTRAIATLAHGDTLIVAKLDRLARSTRDLLNVLADIAQRGATFKSLGDPWADTTTPPAGPMAKPWLILREATP
jgi:hypothetical protein